MEASYRILKRRWRMVAAFGAVGLLVSALATFVQPLRYGSTVRLLIIQKSIFGVDPFTAIKSAERVAQNLSEVLTTTDFFTKVLAEDPTIDQSYFSEKPTIRRRQWKRMVRTELTPNTGLLTVTILHPAPEEAGKVAQAVSDVFTTRGREYVGGDLEIKLVDAPLGSRFPVSPNIPVNLGAGLFVGVLIGVVYVLRMAARAHPVR